MERVFGGADKVIMDSSAAGGAGVVPYLLLPDLRNRTQAQPTGPATGTQSAGGAR
jgi:membrane protease subunit HflK